MTLLIQFLRHLIHSLRQHLHHPTHPPLRIMASVQQYLLPLVRAGMHAWGCLALPLQLDETLWHAAWADIYVRGQQISHISKTIGRALNTHPLPAVPSFADGQAHMETIMRTIHTCRQVVKEKKQAAPLERYLSAHAQEGRPWHMPLEKEASTPLPPAEAPSRKEFHPLQEDHWSHVIQTLARRQKQAILL